MKDSSRKKALSSAKELFMEKGKDGVRMQEIADHAGVNKGLLHYYFKSKEKLFLEIFSDEIGHIYGDINSILQGEGSLDNKLSAIIDRYFELLEENPKLPTFIMFEINKNPQVVKEFSSEMNLEQTIGLLDTEFRLNRVTSTPEFAFQVLLNIISLCVFPFMMRPMAEEMADKNGMSWPSFIEKRKEFLKGIIINSFKP